MICWRCGREIAAGAPSPCPACSRPPKRLAVLLALIVALALPAGATASPPQPLAAIASGIAGHPVAVECVSDYPAWGSLLLEFYGSLDGSSGVVEAFSDQAGATIYLGPLVCPDLLQMEAGELPPAYLAARSLLDLAHESVHQRGVLDESVTDCTALTLVRQTALELGVPALVRQAYQVRHRLRRHRRWVVVRVTRHRLVANPWLAQTQVSAEELHRERPPQYQGAC